MKKYISLSGYILLYFGIAFVSFLSLTFIWIHWMKPLNFLYMNSNFINVLGFSTTLAVICIVFKSRKLSLIKTCGFNKLSLEKFIPILAAGIMMGVLSCAICNTGLVHNNIKSFEKYLWDLEHGNTSVVLFAVTMLITVVFEEMVFRGVIFKEILSRVSLYKAIFISAAVYGLVNILNPGLLIILYAFVSAVLYTLAYVYTGSIISNIILQVTSLAIIYAVRAAGLWYHIGELGDAVLIAVIAAAALIMLACYYLMYRSYKKQNIPESSQQPKLGLITSL